MAVEDGKIMRAHGAWNLEHYPALCGGPLPPVVVVEGVGLILRNVPPRMLRVVRWSNDSAALGKHVARFDGRPLVTEAAMEPTLVGCHPPHVPGAGYFGPLVAVVINRPAAGGLLTHFLMESAEATLAELGRVVAGPWSKKTGQAATRTVLRIPPLRQQRVGRLFPSFFCIRLAAPVVGAVRRPIHIRQIGWQCRTLLRHDSSLGRVLMPTK